MLLIAKYPVSARGMENAGRYEWTAYCDCDPSDEDNGDIISKSEALQLIRDHGLVKVHEGEDGAIYEAPDRPVYRKYCGAFRRRLEELRKERSAVAKAREAAKVTKKRGPYKPRRPHEEIIAEKAAKAAARLARMYEISLEDDGRFHAVLSQK